MGLSDELQAIAAVAAGHAAPGEELEGVLAAEPGPGRRVYLCAFAAGEARSWIALDRDGAPLERRELVREAASIAGLCELAAETAGGGALEELRAELVALRLRENPPGIDEAEDAALALERVVGTEPRLATPSFLDEVGAATRRLEAALGETSSPFAEVMRHAHTTVDALVDDVERSYKRPLG